MQKRFIELIQLLNLATIVLGFAGLESQFGIGWAIFGFVCSFLNFTIPYKVGVVFCFINYFHLHWIYSFPLVFAELWLIYPLARWIDKKSRSKDIFWE